jgi:hypothetical protein
MSQAQPRCGASSAMSSAEPFPGSAVGPAQLAPRRIALTVGVLFLITFVAAIPAVFLLWRMTDAIDTASRQDRAHVLGP